MHFVSLLAALISFRLAVGTRYPPAKPNHPPPAPNHPSAAAKNDAAAPAEPSQVQKAVASSIGPIVQPTAGSYVYALCAVEPFYNGIQARALHGGTLISSNMMVQACAQYCSSTTGSGPFSYFGVEYSSECYCGNKVNIGTTQDLVGGCNQVCSGNSGQYCGGSGRMNFYQASSISTALSLPTSFSVATQQSTSVSGWKYVECVAEPFQLGSTKRALNGINYASSGMTVESCAAFCAGYTYFGVEYSQECYCGNTLDSHAAVDSASNCNMGCTGNDQETCGGPGRLSLYQVSSGSSPVLSTVSSTSSTGTTSSSSTASSSSSSTTSSSTSTTSTTSSISSSSKKTTPTTTSTSTTPTTSSSSSTTSSSTSSTSRSSTTTTSYSSCSNLPTVTTVSGCSPTATGTSFYSYTANNYQYSAFYSGSGYLETASNPGTTGSYSTNKSVTYTNNNERLTSCQAISYCAAFAENQNAANGLKYMSYSITFHQDTCLWNCTAFAGPQSNASYWSVANGGVFLGYGYSYAGVS